MKNKFLFIIINRWVLLFTSAKIYIFVFIYLLTVYYDTTFLIFLQLIALSFLRLAPPHFPSLLLIFQYKNCLPLRFTPIAKPPILSVVTITPYSLNIKDFFHLFACCNHNFFIELIIYQNSLKKISPTVIIKNFSM